jgi:hypothetical protein
MHSQPSARQAVLLLRCRSLRWPQPFVAHRVLGSAIPLLLPPDAGSPVHADPFRAFPMGDETALDFHPPEMPAGPAAAEVDHGNHFLTIFTFLRALRPVGLSPRRRQSCWSVQNQASRILLYVRFFCLRRRLQWLHFLMSCSFPSSAASGALSPRRRRAWTCCPGRSRAGSAGKAGRCTPGEYSHASASVFSPADRDGALMAGAGARVAGTRIIHR